MNAPTTPRIDAPSVSPAPPSPLPRTLLPRGIGGDAPVSFEVRDRFERRRPLGAGGMGRVDLAFDHDIEREVAVKRLHDDLHDPASILRFASEVRTLGRLEHPGIPAIHDVGTDPQGRYYLVMPFLRGETLASVIERLRNGDPAYHQKYTFTRRLEVFAKILDAVGHAHDAGVVHRDLKPENVMVGPRGEVVVLDWGIAKRLGVPEAEGREPLPGEGESLPSERDGDTLIATPRTRCGVLLGTPAYMAPEQAVGRNDEVDCLSDVYSLSVLLYELMTLRHYLHDVLVDDSPDGLQAVLEAVQNRAPEPAAMVKSASQSGVPAEVSHFLQRGQQKDKQARWPDVTAMRDEVDAMLAGHIRVQCPITLSKRVLFELGHLIDRDVNRSLFVIIALLLASIVAAVLLLS